jgi:DNA-binding NtrC family response regulator
MAKILIMDDEEDVRFSIMDALKLHDENHEFTEASSVKECLSSLKKDQHDLVIMDVSSEHSFNAASELKKANKNLPMILLSTTADQNQRYKASQFSHALLDKPFVITELNSAITQILEK